MPLRLTPSLYERGEGPALTVFTATGSSRFRAIFEEGVRFDMHRSTLIAWLAALGVAVHLSSRLLDSQPILALAVVVAVLLFFAYAVAYPQRN